MNYQSILVIGAGELGTAILDGLRSHPSFNREKTSLTLLLRASSIQSTSPEKQAQLSYFRDRRINVVSGDIDQDDLNALTDTFSIYTTVIHAAGMTSPPGTQTKITQAVLDAGVKLYIPWQHGVDYDVIGREGGQGMFSEQIGVRETLRAQSNTHWLIISCGMFMSFLFEEFWGVIARHPNGTLKVTALNSWNDMITATTARDIGRCTAELLLRPDMPRDRPVFIAGDTLSYAELAETIERETGKTVLKEVWSLSYLREESKKDPKDQLKRYRVVFSEGRGLSWPKDRTWNAQIGLDMESVSTWVKSSLP